MAGYARAQRERKLMGALPVVAAPVVPTGSSRPAIGPSPRATPVSATPRRGSWRRRSVSVGPAKPSLFWPVLRPAFQRKLPAGVALHSAPRYSAPEVAIMCPSGLTARPRPLRLSRRDRESLLA